MQDTYKLVVDIEKQTLVLRTTNKKYFKVFKVPALVRAGLPLEQSSLRKTHDGGSTLIISYVKPKAITDEERKSRAGARNANSASLQTNGIGGGGGPQGNGGSGAGDGHLPECKQS